MNCKDEIVSYNGTIVELQLNHYADNNSLAIVMIEAQSKGMYAVLTVNLDTPLTNENCQFIDTNNLERAEEFIEEYNLGVPTGRVEQSGFCLYPEYDFTKLVMDMQGEE